MFTAPARNAHLRWLIRRDMPEILAIEQSLPGEQWAEDDFLRVLRQRNAIGFSAEIGERVVGYMVYELHKTRLELVRFAVHPAYRRKGVGRQLILKLRSKLSPDRRSQIRCQMPETLLPSQLFLRACGFRAEGVDRRFFRDNDEDAYRMVFTIAETANRVADTAII